VPNVKENRVNNTITLKLIKDQKQAKNNMHSETINHLIP